MPTAYEKAREDLDKEWERAAYSFAPVGTDSSGNTVYRRERAPNSNTDYLSAELGRRLFDAGY